VRWYCRLSAQARATFAPTIHQQRSWIIPASHGERVSNVGARQTDVLQHVIVEAGQKFQVAPILPKLMQGHGELSDQTNHHAVLR